MPSQRINATELARLLNSISEPVYVLDEDLTLVFFNRACREWLGESSEGILGNRCAYHSSPSASGPEAAAARLCPPPQVLDGIADVAVVSCQDAEQNLRERRARFMPLASGEDNVFGVIAILDNADLTPEQASLVASPSMPREEAPSALHEQIVRFRQTAAARYRADRLIGSGPAVRLARRQVELAVGSRCSVLLIGPQGSGRQHLATAIHYGSHRPASAASKAGGFAALDCSLLAFDSFDSLTAAIAKVGGVEPASAPGTILLTRIDELAADLQAELALLLERRPLPLRLIATAAQPLSELARRGAFRKDLAAALSTLVIELPPLTQRREDLPVLAQLFLEETNAHGTRQLGGFTHAALDALDAYPWPGNLDELAGVVADAHRRATGMEIDAKDLPEKLHWVAQAAAHPRRTEEKIVLDDYLARIERELIERALNRSKRNKAKAARLLGMTRPRLYRRMVQLGLEQEAGDEAMETGDGRPGAGGGEGGTGDGRDPSF